MDTKYSNGNIANSTKIATDAGNAVGSQDNSKENFASASNSSLKTNSKMNGLDSTKRPEEGKYSVTPAGQAGFSEIKADLKAIVADFESLSAHTEETLESAKAALAEGLKVVGEKIESLGNKLNITRFSNIGKALEKLGNRVEHFHDHRSS
jgi:hypothetical protein